MGSGRSGGGGRKKKSAESSVGGEREMTKEKTGNSQTKETDVPKESSSSHTDLPSEIPPKMSDAKKAARAARAARKAKASAPSVDPSAQDRLSGGSRPWKVWLLMFTMVVIGFLAVLTGWQANRAALDANDVCEMTYHDGLSRPVTVPVPGGWSSYQLFAYPAYTADGTRKECADSATMTLNSHPVLFVPGHLGSYQQARSFASGMQASGPGGGNLQYFSIDFRGEPVGLSGGDVLQKAAYVNDALRAIRRLYHEKQQEGHSYGGFVSKTALTLTSHPRCAVANIIMLGAPNVRAPFTPDSTMRRLLHDVNAAYYFSGTGSFAAANSGSVVGTLGEHEVDYEQCPKELLSTKSAIRLPVKLLPTGCGACLRQVRLLSYSGGELDSYISPDLTDVFTLSPVPRNASLVATQSSSGNVFTLDIYIRAKQWARKYAKNVVNSFLGKSLSTDDMDETCLGNGDQCQSTSEASRGSGIYSFITRDSWNKDILPYAEPLHLSVRSSQLEDVGHNVDHFALLWCRDFVSSVTRTIRKLAISALESSESGKESLQGLHSVVPLDKSIRKEISLSLADVEDLDIPHLSRFVPRNVTYHAFQAAGVMEEKEIFRRLAGVKSTSRRDLEAAAAAAMHSEWWRRSALLLMSRDAGKVAVSFGVIALLALASKFLRVAAGVWTNSGPVRSALCIDELTFLLRLARHSLFTSSGRLSGVASTVAAVFAVLVLRFFRGGLSANLLTLRRWFLAVCVAMACRVVVAISLRILRLTAHISSSPIALIAALPIFDGVGNRIWNRLPRVLRQLCSGLVVIAVLTGVLYSYAITLTPYQGGLLGSGNLMLAALNCSIFIGAVLYFIRAFFLPVPLPKHYGDTVQQDKVGRLNWRAYWSADGGGDMDLAFLLLALLSLTALRVYFEWCLLTIPTPTGVDQSMLFSTLSSDRLNMLTLLLAVLLVCRYRRHSPLEIDSIAAGVPLPSLVSLFLFHATRDAPKSTTSTGGYSSSGSGWKKCSADGWDDEPPCYGIHEDGGPTAHYVCRTGAEGETIFVVSRCDCAKTPGLDSSAYCSFCRCVPCKEAAQTAAILRRSSAATAAVTPATPSDVTTTSDVPSGTNGSKSWLATHQFSFDIVASIICVVFAFWLAFFGGEDYVYCLGSVGGGIAALVWLTLTLGLNKSPYFTLAAFA